MTLAPGEGFWLNWPEAAPGTITFVGDVMQGTLTNPVPAGYSIADRWFRKRASW